jgi:heptaprenyl diphosphate synthase
VTLHVITSNDPSDARLRELLLAPITDESIIADVLSQLRAHRALDTARSQLR